MKFSTIFFLSCILLISANIALQGQGTSVLTADGDTWEIKYDQDNKSQEIQLVFCRLESSRKSEDEGATKIQDVQHAARV